MLKNDWRPYRLIWLNFFQGSEANTARQSNSRFYDDLISRARRIEEELGIDTGQFRGSKDASNKLINHSVATKG